MQTSLSLKSPRFTIRVYDTIAYLWSVYDQHCGVIGSIPNRSHDLTLKKLPLLNMSSFFSTNSRFLGSLMTTPGGSDGTVIANVSKPKRRSHLTNQENSLCRSWRNRRPFPTNGRVSGASLNQCQLGPSKIASVHSRCCVRAW